jgi:general secretion pathway protein K
MTGRDHERGLALVVVLWVIAALSLIAGAMLAVSMTSAKIENNSWTQLEIRTAADTAIERAILSLFDPGNPTPVDGREREISAGGVSVTLSVQDQSGLIDVNYAGPGLLRTVFKANGVDTEAANRMVDRILDWRSPPGTQHLNGVSDTDYRSAAYRPRNAPFQSLDELTLVMGMTPEIYGRVVSALTVYSHRSDFDLRVAPRQVLLVIPGMDEARADLTLAARTAAFARPGHAFAIVAKAQRNQIWFSRRVVVLLTGDPAQPYKILDWR